MDLKKFLSSDRKPRQKDVAVPELKEWFDGDDSPSWTVRGLEGAELGRAKESKAKAENLSALVTAIVADGDKSEALKKSLGLDHASTPEDISYRIDLLTTGSVAPALGDNNRDVAVKLARDFPVTFYKLTNEILNLTGAGSEPGKLKSSGKTSTSASG